jgi:hypothetical protein
MLRPDGLLREREHTLRPPKPPKEERHR